MKRIHHRRFYVHHGRDNRIRNVVQVKEPFYVSRREGLVDKMLDHFTLVRHQRHFRPAIPLIDTQIHLSPIPFRL